MTKFMSAIIAVLVFWAFPAIADDKTPCVVPDQPAMITIRPVDSKLDYLFDYDEAGLTALDIQSGGRAVPANMHLHGLTLARYGWAFDFRYSRQRVGKGWCLMPTSVIVSVGFTSTKIYVDRRYQSGSCQRRAVLIHEAKHVGLNYEEMNIGIPRIEADMKRAWAAAHFPIYVESQVAGEKYIKDYFSYIIHAGFDRIDQGIHRRNLALDNPQEYASITALCSKW